MAGPVVCVVAYPWATSTGEPAKFDMDYYLSGHMVLIDKHWRPFGLKSWSVTRCSAEDSLGGSSPPYCVQATLNFDSVDQIKEALAKGSEETGKDIANYTNVKPTIWVSRSVEGKDN